MASSKISIVIPADLKDRIKMRASKNFRCLSGEIAAVLSKEFPERPPVPVLPPMPAPPTPEQIAAWNKEGL
jgi:hypothetical protein